MIIGERRLICGRERGKKKEKEKKGGKGRGRKNKERKRGTYDSHRHTRMHSRECTPHTGMRARARAHTHTHTHAHACARNHFSLHFLTRGCSRIPQALDNTFPPPPPPILQAETNIKRHGNMTHTYVTHVICSLIGINLLRPCMRGEYRLGDK